ncbi:hypothetical protein [Stenotrophomonas sp. Iso1]|uniref:hypothetical protein n=1 Tax=Stenotrophomonas sp. Iso1 TaxID=2977283 RepID=UPI0022B7B132|nr:hypothetical protein [Stenotrophomonas sp. Iso1]
MQTEQEPSEQPPAPPMRPARPAPRPAPRSGGLSLGKLAFAAIALVIGAWFLGNKKPAPADSEATATAVESETPPATPPAAKRGAMVIQGEKATTLTAPDEARMVVQEQGSVLRIEGSVGANFATDLRAALEANPSLQRIDITSGGGYAGPGLEAARMIRRRNLVVRVQSQCASMCVALWAAGAQRQMEPDAWIGLHDWDARCDLRPSPDREECNYQVQFATDHDSSYDAWLREAGFNHYLLDLQTKTASKDIAVLTAPQLWENGVDFSVVNHEGARMTRAEVQGYLAEKFDRR